MSSNNGTGSMLESLSGIPNDVYETAGERFDPPAGRLAVRLDSVDVRRITNDRGISAVISLSCTIRDGEFSGKAFEIPLFTTNPVGMRTIKDLLSILGQVVTGDLQKDVVTLKDKSEGMDYALEVSHKGKYVNYKFLEVLG